jgi:hypothetical protein
MINLGDKAKDIVSGFVGIVVAKTEKEDKPEQDKPKVETIEVLQSAYADQQKLIEQLVGACRAARKLTDSILCPMGMDKKGTWPNNVRNLIDSALTLAEQRS